MTAVLIVLTLAFVFFVCLVVLTTASKVVDENKPIQEAVVWGLLSPILILRALPKVWKELRQ